MKDILDKISSYNLFNYLLPGILFVCISKYFTNFNFIQENDFIGVFLYYFIGMVISRFGSLCIEPLLKRISFVKFADYGDYITAAKKDEKVDILSEVNNTYRTLTSMFVILLLLKIYTFFQIIWNIPVSVTYIIAVLVLLIMFLFSYRKQTNYITKRIKKINE
jgi:hypothetical protein